MGVDDYVFVENGNGCPIGPLQTFQLICSQYAIGRVFDCEGCFFCDDQGIIGGVTNGVIAAFILDGL